MTVEENLEILRKILNAIATGNLDKEMSNLDFEVSKDTEKSKEWVLIEASASEQEKVYNQYMIVSFSNNSKRILRFAESDSTNEFVKYIHENENVVQVETFSEPKQVYK